MNDNTLVHPVSDKRDLFVEQKGKCTGCGIALPYAYFEVDHIHPRAKGGGDERSNLQMLCPPCNRHKGTRSQEEFMSTVVRIEDQPAYKARMNPTDENILALEVAAAEARQTVLNARARIAMLRFDLERLKARRRSLLYLIEHGTPDEESDADEVARYVKRIHNEEVKLFMEL